MFVRLFTMLEKEDLILKHVLPDHLWVTDSEHTSLLNISIDLFQF